MHADDAPANATDDGPILPIELVEDDDDPLPCPFCGLDRGEVWAEHSHYAIRCSYCGSRTRPYSAVEQAWKAWSRRRPEEGLVNHWHEAQRSRDAFAGALVWEIAETRGVPWQVVPAQAITSALTKAAAASATLPEWVSIQDPVALADLIHEVCRVVLGQRHRDAEIDQQAARLIQGELAHAFALAMLRGRPEERAERERGDLTHALVETAQQWIVEHCGGEGTP